MKIDHLVVNVDASVQEDTDFITQVHHTGLPYEPKWGKGTKGFKVSNIWIGDEYFELVRIKSKDGGGWLPQWTAKYNEGHRGLIGFCLEVNDIQAVYQALRQKEVQITEPQPLKFRWFFNLLSRTMPWKNTYIQELEGIPFQFFLQQLNDEKTKAYMQKYMVPNSKEKNINGISEVIIYGALTEKDKQLIMKLFDHATEQEGKIIVPLEKQSIIFIEAEQHSIEVILDCSNEEFNNKQLSFNNVLIRNN